MYIYTQTRTTHDSPPPGVQLFTSASVYTGPVGTARQDKQPFKLTRDAYSFSKVGCILWEYSMRVFCSSIVWIDSKTCVAAMHLRG